MKYYDFPLTDKQKQHLISLVASVPMTEAVVHEWIVKDFPTEATNLVYILPEYRESCVISENRITHTKESFCVDMWKLCEELGHKLPVDGKMMIVYFNEIASGLDNIYAGKKE